MLACLRRYRRERALSSLLIWLKNQGKVHKGSISNLSTKATGEEPGCAPALRLLPQPLQAAGGAAARDAGGEARDLRRALAARSTADLV